MQGLQESRILTAHIGDDLVAVGPHKAGRVYKDAAELRRWPAAGV
ncbi:MAG TPA: hypothetical protein VFG22_02760 [Polyangiales bacterium]|nr:hypothetical protein [Polyangiales bacterium]